MPSERIQRQIDRFLDEAEQALSKLDWDTARSRAQAVLALDPENGDALTLVAAADRAAEQGVTAAPTERVAPLARPATPDPAPALPTSFTNGRYEVKRFLGEGGKKRVYLAHDTLLDRDVAFALIKTDGLDDAGVARIRREAQAMGRLGDHPNIVTVHDIGEEPSTGSGQGQPYIVSQFMAGGDVDGLIEKAEGHKLPLEQAFLIADQVCQALDHAHSHGIIHRDLKPGNVWLSDQGAAKLGDFGLAVALDRSRLTQAGMMVGTVSYMPPEQALGGEVKYQSDLYSLGAMLYEMVAGRPPFVGDDTIAIIGQHINTPPVAPSWHRPDCPQPLEALILRLLEKDPAKRPATAAEVRHALQAIDLAAHGEPVEPRAGANSLDRLARGTFVGRAQETAQGRAMVDDALSGRVGFLLLSGELGIGKTRLAEEVGTYAAMRGALVLSGVSYRDQGAPAYWPWVQALRGYVRGREPARLRSELGSAGPEVAKIVSELRERLPDLPQPTPGDPAQERFRLFDSVAGFLRNASANQPLVIFLDNVHFADQPTLLLAQFLLQEAGEARILLIGAYREVEEGRHHPVAQVLAELAQERRFRELPLRGLAREETGRLMEAITGASPSPALVERVFSATEGVPLFVEEMVRYLTEEGKLEAAPASLAIPRNIRSVIGQRLDRLTPEVNEALTLAALVSREFDLAVLRELTARDEDSLLELLDGAIHARIIEEVPGSVSRYQFVHGMTRQVLTADLTTARRVRLHGRIGEALERAYGRQAERHAAELAFHFGQAAALSGAQEKALRYAALAAVQAETSHAYEEAIAHSQFALDLMQEAEEDTATTLGQVLGQDEVALRRGLATAQRFANLIPEAFRNFRRAFRLAQARGDRQATAELALEQVRTGFVPRDLRVRTLKEGLEAVPDPESELAAMMHLDFAIAQETANPQEAEEQRQRAQEVAARHGYREVELLLTVSEVGRAARALQLNRLRQLQRGLEEIEGELGRVFWRDLPYGRGFLLFGDVSSARRVAQRMLEAARRARDTGNNWNLIRAPAMAHYLLGEFADIPRVLELDRPHEPDEMKEMARAVLAEVRGDLDAARAGAEAAIAVSSRLRIISNVIRGTVILAGLERRAGNQNQSDNLYQQALRQRAGLPPEQQPAPERNLTIHAELGLEAAVRGDADTMARCREVLEPYEGLVATGFNSPVCIVVGRALGAIAAAEGRWQEAIGHLERAEAFCQEKGLVVELAHCRLALSDALLHRSPAHPEHVEGRAARGSTGSPRAEPSREARQRAIALLDQAQAEYQRLGMPLYVQDCLARRELLRA